MNKKFISPQPGPQTKFLEAKEDIVIYGGSAGSGKSHALLLDPLRFKKYKLPINYTIFRRTTPQITNPGALLDNARNLYLQMNARNTHLDFIFPEGLTVTFSHLESESNIYDWQGSQMEAIGFDELTHFTEKQFFYMMSRLRSTLEVGSYIRATCNPDPDSFVRKLIDWWIDKEGYPIPERSGKARWFTRENDEIIWHDRKVNENAKSFTFIPAKLSDNKILLEKDPNYKANLESLSYVERMRLLYGNWNIKEAAGLYFKRHYFELVDTIPAKCISIRYWDRASSTTAGSAYTVGVKMHRHQSGLFFISDVRRLRGSPLEVREAIKNTAIQDGYETIIGIEQDPGQAGVVEATDYVRLLSGFNVRLNKVSKDKVTRASPFSSQCEAKNVKLIKALWNDAYLSELESFPEGKYMDQVDASSGAFNLLTQGMSGTFTKEMAIPGKTFTGSLRGEQVW